jgi:hypothetical protein
MAIDLVMQNLLFKSGMEGRDRDYRHFNTIQEKRSRWPVQEIRSCFCQSCSKANIGYLQRDL